MFIKTDSEGDCLTRLIMRRIALLFISIILFLSGFTQEAILMKGKGYTGYIFRKEHFVFMTVENQKERFTPSKEDIAYAEILLEESIHNYLKSEKIHTSYIKQNTLKEYKRQYVGFINNHGDKIIFIKFFKGPSLDSLSREIVDIFDGGENYWSIEINITQRKLLRITINGEA
jgi:hypothetical protein